MQSISSFVLVLCLAACNAEDVMTPQQRENAAEIEKGIEERNRVLDEKGRQAEDILEGIKERAALGLDISAQVEEFRALTTEYDQLLGERDAEIENLHRKYGEAVEEKTGGISNVVKAIPVVGPYAEWLLLAVPFLFKRNQKIFKDTLKYRGRGQLWQLLALIPRVAGLMNTTNDPVKAAKNAAELAEKKDRPVLAEKIQQAVGA